MCTALPLRLTCVCRAWKGHAFLTSTTSNGSAAELQSRTDMPANALRSAVSAWRSAAGARLMAQERESIQDTGELQGVPH